MALVWRCESLLFSHLLMRFYLSPVLSYEFSFGVSVVQFYVLLWLPFWFGLAFFLVHAFGRLLLPLCAYTMYMGLEAG